MKMGGTGYQPVPSGHWPGETTAALASPPPFNLDSEVVRLTGTGMDCGGKRSATPLSIVGKRTLFPTSESAVAAELCRRTPHRGRRVISASKFNPSKPLP